MTSFSKLREKQFLEPNEFRRLAYSMAHAYLRGSSAFNEQRVLEVAKDAPKYVHMLLKEEELPHFNYNAQERITPVDTNRRVDSFRMMPDEAESLGSRLGMDFPKDEKKIYLSPTETVIELSKGEKEKAWLFRTYDPVRPLVDSGTHSFFELDPNHTDSDKREYAMQYLERINISGRSANALNLLQTALEDEKAAFVYTSKNKESIAFLIPEHVAKKLEVKLRKAELDFEKILPSPPLSSIDDVGHHEGLGESAERKFR